MTAGTFPAATLGMQHDHYERWMRAVCDQLNRLIQLDVDASGTYREAIAHVTDIDVRDDLEAFMADHDRHVMELTSIVRDLGGTPIPVHRDFKGRILEGMTRLRSRGTLGALRAMRMNERLTNRVYDRATHVYMPPLGQVIVIENLDDERRHLFAIEAHITRLSDTGLRAPVFHQDTRIDSHVDPTGRPLWR